MPTLDAMFKLMDGYSSTIKRIVEGTDKASKSILGASKRTDDFNDALKRTEAATARASNGLSRLVKTAVGLTAVKKGMDLADVYTNTNARLGMITNSLAEQRSLQNDIFAAANRARGSYTEMASAASKMRMLAGDSFGSNQEAVAFTELLTKSLKVSGAGTAEQNAAFLQISQAMAAGRLQGDEFRSVMENAPMVADAIAQYMGKSKGELKELSSQGLITADIVKNAMFQAAGDIEDRFSSMPMTFADVWQRIKNDGVQAFGGVFDKANAILNSEAGQKTISVLTKVVFISAGAFSLLLSAIGWVGNRLDVLSPIILGVAAAWAVYNATAGIGWLTTMKNVAVMGLKATADMAEYAAIFMLTWAQEGFNAALLACPITWIIGGIILLIAAFYAGVAAVNHFTGASISATGLIGAAIGGFAASTTNSFILIYNIIAEVVNFFANVWQHPVTAVKILFYDLAITVIGYMAEMARSVEAIINRIPGVEVQISAGLDNFKAGIEKAAASAKNSSDWNEVVKKKDFVNGADFANKGYEVGSNLADKASNLFSDFNPSLDGAGGSGIDFSSFATAGNPATVKGTGKGGAVKVETEKEDIEWMRKLAERDYVARIAQNTLAPNIRVEFSGPITKETDTDSVMTHVVNELKDIIATAPEGVPV